MPIIASLQFCEEQGSLCTLKERYSFQGQLFVIIKQTNTVRIQSCCVYPTEPTSPPALFSGAALFQNPSLTRVCRVCSSHPRPLGAGPAAARSQPQGHWEKINHTCK